MKNSILQSYILYAIRIFLPIILLPILSQRLGISNFGQILALQSLGLIGSLIVQFGFGITAARDIAQAQDQTALTAVIEHVLSAQILTSLLAVGFILLSSQFASLDTANLTTVSGTALIAIGAGISPAWYFRGTNRSQTGIALDLAGQILSTLGIWLFIHRAEDIALTAVILGLGPTLTSMFGIAVMVKERGPLKLKGLSDALQQLRQSLSLFTIRATSSGLTLGSAWFASLLMKPEEVAYFGVASKIVSALTSMPQPILYAILPRAARYVANDKKAFFILIRKWGCVLAAFGATASLASLLLAPWLISILFGKELMPAMNVLYVLSWLCLTSAVRDVLSDIILLPLRADRMVAITSIASFLFILALSIPLALDHAAVGMASARLFGEGLAVFGLAIIAVKKLKKISIQNI